MQAFSESFVSSWDTLMTRSRFNVSEMVRSGIISNIQTSVLELENNSKAISTDYTRHKRVDVRQEQ